MRELLKMLIYPLILIPFVLNLFLQRALMG
jgi:hypothetical protein